MAQRKHTRVRFTRAGVITKLVVLSLLIVVAISLLNLRGTIQSATAARDALQAKVDEQTQINAALADDIKNSDDPDRVLAVAKERMGLVEDDEVVFYDSAG